MSRQSLLPLVRRLRFIQASRACRVSHGWIPSHVVDDRRAYDERDPEEQECADDGDELGYDAHVSFLLFFLTLLAADEREQPEKLRWETAFCLETALWGTFAATTHIGY